MATAGSQKLWRPAGPFIRLVQVRPPSVDQPTWTSREVLNGSEDALLPHRRMLGSDGCTAIEFSESERSVLVLIGMSGPATPGPEERRTVGVRPLARARACGRLASSALAELSPSSPSSSSSISDAGTRQPARSTSPIHSFAPGSMTRRIRIPSQSGSRRRGKGSTRDLPDPARGPSRPAWLASSSQAGRVDDEREPDRYSFRLSTWSLTYGMFMTVPTPPSAFDWSMKIGGRGRPGPTVVTCTAG